MDCLLSVKAVPNAPRNKFMGWLGDAAKIKLKAPPVEGKANEALIEFLSDQLGLPCNAITLERGATSRQKTIRVTGMSLDEVKGRLA